MRNNILFSILFVLIMTGLYVPVSYSQNPTFTVTLTNDQQPDASHYQFDVYILRTGSNSFELSGSQFSFIFNTGILNSGTLTAAWDMSATGLNSGNSPLPAPNTATAGVIKCGSKIPPGAGSGTIISNTGLGTKIGTLKLSNTASFLSSGKLGVDFLTIGQNAYYTKISAYVAGSNVELTLIVPTLGTFSNLLGNAPLPIEINSFNSNVTERQVNLSWTTKTEQNSSRFEIERSIVNANGATGVWAAVGVVPASGSSNSPKKYSFTEKDLQAGKQQYRLKLVDNNGSFKYSSVIETEIAIPKNFEVSQNYPNPFNPSTRINYSLPFDSRVTVEVFNITGASIGQILNQEQSAGYYSVNFNSSGLYKSIASGVYIYRVTAADKSSGKSFSSIKKMMLLK
jgi:hypothetical protein